MAKKTKKSAVSLKDLVSGKSDAVAAAVAEHAAKKHAAEPKKGAAKKKAAKAKAAVAPKASKPERKTIASCIRAAILDGKNNEDVFLAARAELGADVVTDDKRWFAGWYRADMKRKGAKNVPPSVPSKREVA